MDIAIIPAYNPDEKLIQVASELYERGIGDIIVVNDGSKEQYFKIFERLSGFATVLTHVMNNGKGAAIKTALHYISKNMPDAQGIVILDADGQHRPEDAMHLLAETHNNYASLVLGVRCFEGAIPLRSRFGNMMTKYVFRLFSGKWVSDTQTGLRAFSVDMIPMFLKVSGDRYEYEMNVLLTCAKNKVTITEVPIATIYHDESNSCSHFRTVRDSIRIYGNLFAFSGASFVSFLLDYILFFVFVWALGFGFAEATALIYANIGARFISAAFNYYLNSTFVFRNKESRVKSIVSYAMLACMILILNTGILYSLHDYLGLREGAAKLITEMLLFFISFTVQRYLIFHKVRKEEAVTL